MRQGSILSAVLVTLNLAVVALAVYVAVDATDLSRQQSGRTEQSQLRLAAALDRLNSGLERLERLESLPAARSEGVASPSPRRNSAPFANSEFIDPLAEAGGSLVGQAASFTGNLNYLINNEAMVGGVWSLCVSGLASRNNNDITLFEPLLAESWEVSQDGLEYTIHLRRNALWQPYLDPVSGLEVAEKPVTSDDFLFFWETIQNPNIPCEAIRSYFEFMQGIEVVDPYTFRVVWKEPYSLSESMTLDMQPLPRHYYRPDPNWDDRHFADQFISSPRNQWLVGTGPYRLSAWDKNRELVLTVDPNYFGPKPAIETRRTRLLPDPTVSFLEFKRDQLDIYGLTPAQWREESPEPDFVLVTPDIRTAPADSRAWEARKKAGETPENYQFEKYQYNGSSWAYLGYNLQRPLFRDRQVRQALTRLVDRERILEEVFLGLGEVITGPFIPRSPYYNHQVEMIPFDVEAAKDILQKAGWEDTDADGILDRDYDDSGVRKPFTFTFIIPSSSTLIRRWAAIIEQDFLKASIKPIIKPIEWSVYTQALDERDFDVCSLLWTGGIEGDPFQIWHGSGVGRDGSSNYIGYNSPEANQLIEEGRRTLDKEKRYAIYQRLHSVISEDQPYTFLVAPTATLAKSKRFRNSVVYEGGGMDSLLEWIPRQLQLAR
ncbi:MAG: ABC transporter substrate-binding protein [Planctomycetota bacterium]|jgi:ABC-type transport system substrate-binding protein|nr:ABC transporter substrate-binding protein [Planctomycetota bacterium]